MLTVSNYFDGELHGLFLSFHNNGKIAVSVHCKHEKKTINGIIIPRM